MIVLMQPTRSGDDKRRTIDYENADPRDDEFVPRWRELGPRDVRGNNFGRTGSRGFGGGSRGGRGGWDRSRTNTRRQPTMERDERLEAILFGRKNGEGFLYRILISLHCSA
jgi:hypothetical protein